MQKVSLYGKSADYGTFPAKPVLSVVYIGSAMSRQLNVPREGSFRFICIAVCYSRESSRFTPRGSFLPTYLHLVAPFSDQKAYQ
jgi:hypothetical protein